MSALAQILKHKIVAIIRGAVPGDVLKIAQALESGGVIILEITLNSEGALDVISDLGHKMGDRILIGAGTVLDAHSAKAAVDAGAKFIISPNFDIEVVQTTKQHHAVSIPGAYTPTEVVNAHHHGGDMIKIFPATNAEYIKALRAPLSHIPMMPTGGITIENIADFQKAGAAAFGIGTALVDTKHTIDEAYLKQIKGNACKFVQAVS